MVFALGLLLTFCGFGGKGGGDSSGLKVPGPVVASPFTGSLDE